MGRVAGRLRALGQTGAASARRASHRGFVHTAGSERCAWALATERVEALLSHRASKSRREQDYAYTLPTALAKKIRTIELIGGRERRRGGDGKPVAINREQCRALER
jgi:hypothetical protein